MWYLRQEDADKIAWRKKRECVTLYAYGSRDLYGGWGDRTYRQPGAVHALVEGHDDVAPLVSQEFCSVHLRGKFSAEHMRQLQKRFRPCSSCFNPFKLDAAEPSGPSEKPNPKA